MERQVIIAATIALGAFNLWNIIKQIRYGTMLNKKIKDKRDALISEMQLQKIQKINSFTKALKKDNLLQLYELYANGKNSLIVFRITDQPTIWKNFMHGGMHFIFFQNAFKAISNKPCTSMTVQYKKTVQHDTIYFIVCNESSQQKQDIQNFQAKMINFENELYAIADYAIELANQLPYIQLNQ